MNLPEGRAGLSQRDVWWLDLGVPGFCVQGKGFPGGLINPQFVSRGRESPLCGMLATASGVAIAT